MPSKRARRIVPPMVAAALVLFLVPGVSRASTLPDAPGCSVLPADNVWNADVSGLPVDPDSATYVASIGATAPLHPDFGAGKYHGQPIGIPYTVVPGSQPFVPVHFGDPSESDPGPYPIPKKPLIEGGPHAKGDRHVLVVDAGTCTDYELFAARPRHHGSSWKAGSGAVFDLGSDALRPATWTSADAAGLPILPGLIRPDEVSAGVIDHAIRVTVPASDKRFIWPARHQAGTADATLPPMGLRLRLKASVDISHFLPMDQVILQALKTYGMIVADNGSPWFISGVPSSYWDNDTLHALTQITGSDFEAVDESCLMVSADSGATDPAHCTGAG